VFQNHLVFVQGEALPVMLYSSIRGGI